MADNSQDIRPKRENKKIFLFVGLLIVLLAGAYMSSKLKKPAQEAEKINFDLYVMSQCPYGSQAENSVFDAMNGFQDYINFNVEYIANKNEDGSFGSLHGENEIQGNIYQLCVKKHFSHEFWPYIKCQNKNYQDLASSFESCANEVGANFDIIKECAEGEEGAELLSSSLAKAKAVNAAASPTFYLDGQQYTGPRTKIGLQRAFCSVLQDKPKICKDIPQDKKFTAYLINDSRCKTPECDTSRLEQQLKNNFSKIKFEQLDYNQKKGKEFYKKYNLTYLPAVLFDKDIEKTDNYSQIERFLKQTDDLYSLAIGAKHDPAKEICDNGIDDTDNGQVDCNDSDCNGFLSCREEIKNRLDLFVMSMCPYGTKALDAMRKVLDNFGNNIDFHVNYIADQKPDGTFKSLHGQPEIDENIRELCAMKYYPNSYMDYIWCRNKNIKGDWQECAANRPAIKTCFTAAEGKKLLSQNIKLSNELGIGASPTWIVDNRYKFNGIDAETVKTNFCKYNDVAGCDNTLSGQAVGGASAPATGSCN